MIDLHTHTNFSDGSFSPSELLNSARQADLKAVAITDHDTLAGFDAAFPIAAEYGVELVCGVELSTRFDDGSRYGRSMHVLGYFLQKRPDADFQSRLLQISSTRRHRNLKLMEKLQVSCSRISWEDFPHLGPERAARPHFARVLVEKGYVPDVQSAFDLYLADPVLSGIERDVPVTQEAIGWIRQYGGISSLAHPARLHGKKTSLLPIVANLARSGLDAIEAYHSDHSVEERNTLLQIAAESELLVTGGSDFHGENKPGIHLGWGRNGNVQVPDEVLDSLRVKAGMQLT